MKTKTAKPADTAAPADPDAPPAPPAWMTYQPQGLVQKMLDEGLPIPLRPYEELIRRARSKTLPERPRKWRSANGTAKGDDEDDPNFMVSYLIDQYALALDRKRRGESLESDRAMGDGVIQQLHAYSVELEPVMAAEAALAAAQAALAASQSQYEQAMDAWRRAAPERVRSW